MSVNPAVADLADHPQRPADAPTALSGIRVVDFTRLVAGPYATLLLADLGADVIKIENPETGDDGRSIQPPSMGGASGMHVWANRNKRSLALDMRLPAAQAIARELIRTADVVVENFSSGVMKRFGLSYEELSAINSRLIYCAVSAFGRNGKLAARPGYDPLIQGESGFLSLNGEAGRPPVRAGASIVDVTTSMMACNAILAALFARERLGRGQFVEAALFDTAIVMSGQLAMNSLMAGADPVRAGNASITTSPVGLYDASDGQIYLACVNERDFRNLAQDVIGRPDLLDDPAFATNALRMRNRAQLDQVLGEAFAEGSCRDWIVKGEAAGVPIGVVRTLLQALRSDEARDRSMVTRVPHPVAGHVPNIRAPFSLSLTPPVDPVAAPALGEHSQTILRDLLGFDDARIAELAASGIFGAAHAAR